MKNLKIFVGENECYRNYVAKTFSNKAERLEVRITKTCEEIPLGFDIYLLHVSNFNFEQLKKLRENEPISVIMLRTQTAGMMPYSSRDLLPKQRDGFYYLCFEEKNMKSSDGEDLAVRCFEKLSERGFC
jgi:hypothetical protein